MARPPGHARPEIPRWEVEALILSQVDSRDDRIFRLLTERDELVPAMARGVRRAGKRRGQGAVLQPLSRVRLTLSGRPNAEIAMIDEATLISAHPRVTSDLERLGIASCMAEAILHVVPDRASEDGLYHLLGRALHRLETSAEPASPDLLSLFLLRLLDMSGVLPDLLDDPATGSPFASRSAPSAASPYTPLSALSAEARACLTDWRRGRWSALPPALRRPTLLWLEKQLTSLSGRPFKSRLVLDALADLNPASQPTLPARPDGQLQASPTDRSGTDRPDDPAPDSAPDRSR